MYKRIEKSFNDIETVVKATTDETTITITLTKEGENKDG